MESWIGLVALVQDLLRVLEEVDVRRVGLHQVLGILQVDFADRETVVPVVQSLRKKVRIFKSTN